MDKVETDKVAMDKVVTNGTVLYDSPHKDCRDSNKNTNLVIYTIEQLPLPVLMFLMVKNANDVIQLPFSNEPEFFMMDKFKYSEYEVNGCIQYKGENYLFIEVFLYEDFLPTFDEDSWWKVSVSEMIYSQSVLDYPIDTTTISFFKEQPQFLFIYSEEGKYEIPVVGYVGVGESELNEQLLLHSFNQSSKGYVFVSVEDAYKDCLFESSDNHVLKLANRGYLTEFMDIEDKDIVIRDDKFYLGSVFIGDVPSNCKKGKYELYIYDEDVILLTTDQKAKCTEPKDERREEDGCLIRYAVFLGNNYIDKEFKKGKEGKGYNSLSYNGKHTVKSAD